MADAGHFTRSVAWRVGFLLSSVTPFPLCAGRPSCPRPTASRSLSARTHLRKRAAGRSRGPGRRRRHVGDRAALRNPGTPPCVSMCLSSLAMLPSGVASNDPRKYLNLGDFVPVPTPNHICPRLIPAKRPQLGHRSTRSGPRWSPDPAQMSPSSTRIDFGWTSKATSEKAKVMCCGDAMGSGDPVVPGGHMGCGDLMGLGDPIHGLRRSHGLRLPGAVTVPWA